MWGTPHMDAALFAAGIVAPASFLNATDHLLATVLLYLLLANVVLAAWRWFTPAWTARLVTLSFLATYGLHFWVDNTTPPLGVGTAYALLCFAT